MNVDLSSCDFVGDSGCVDKDCPKCHPKSGQKPEIEPMLVLSTGHLSQQTAETLPQDAGDPCDLEWGPTFTREHGWVFHVPPLARDGTPDEVEGTPEELSKAFAYARTHGCTWIMFDNDGPLMDELPEFDW